MIIGRQKELEYILSNITKPYTDDDARHIITIHGMFGVGKSTLVRQCITEIQKNTSADAILLSNEDTKTQYLPEFVFQLINSFRACNTDVPRFRSDETDSRWMRFSQIVADLKRNKPNAWNAIEQRSTLRFSSNLPNSDSDDETTLNNFVRSTYSSTDDQRLILDTGNVVSEACIVDLMNTFYPLNENVRTLQEYIDTRKSPRKIVIIIDTYEKVSTTINHWLLESFLPYCYTKRFGDFRSYNSEFLSPELYIHQFFDIRFIIAGREPLVLTDSERRWDRWKSFLHEIHLDEFTTIERDEYLRTNGITKLSKDELESLSDSSMNVPYLIALWIEVYKAKKSGADETYIATMAQERIFWYKTTEQKEWIRAAAFCDWFDADALRCFPSCNQKAHEAYTYLRQAAELSRVSSTHKNKIALHPIICKNIRLATEQESQTLAKQYYSYAGTFYSASKILGIHNSAERETLRNLAYFSSFDIAHAVAEFLPDDVSTAKNLIDRFPEYFIKNPFTYSLKSETAKILRDYNKLVDSTTHSSKVERVKYIWNERLKEVVHATTDSVRELDTIQNDILELEGEFRQTEHTIATLQTRALEYEQEYYSLKKRGQYRLATRDIAGLRLAFITGASIAVLGYFSSDLLHLSGMDMYEDVPNKIQLLLYSFASIFGILCLFFIARVFYIRSQREEQIKMKKTIEDAEQKMFSTRSELEACVTQRDTIVARLKQSKEHSSAVQLRIETSDEIVKETYV